MKKICENGTLGISGLVLNIARKMQEEFKKDSELS